MSPPQESSGAEETFDKLSAEAQTAANTAIDAVQALMNHGFDAGEEAAGDLLRVADTLQTQVSQLLSQITGHAAAKLGGS